MMHLVKLCFLALWVASLLPVTSSCAASDPYTQTVTAEGLSILQTATQVQTYRVQGTRAAANAIEGKTFDGYTIRRKGPLQGKAFTQRLAKAIAFAVAHPGAPDRCGFSPAVAYRFQGKLGTIDVMFCFHCKDMAVFERNASGKITNETSIRFVGAPYNRIVRVVQASFPDDADLKAFK